ncbi:hypothetical protein [Microbacterium sp. B19]|uniref:hypothetical protein n=1 Tax=Microbacterium sp. B19 TaxID=96765 RepID=UPI0003482CE2|nr:hypothetical protein [Microbacterium sp. B19]
MEDARVHCVVLKVRAVPTPTTGTPAQATAVTSVLADRAGAWAVRVHDVPTTRDALAVARAWEA